MFLLTMFTIIISLMWSIQLIAPMRPSGIVTFLNLAMMGVWITLCVVFVHKYRCPNRKYRLSCYRNALKEPILKSKKKYSKLPSVDDSV